MAKKKTRRSNDLKFKVAIEAIRGEKQVSQIAKQYNVHPQQITDWKKQLLDNGADIFSKKTEKKETQHHKEKEELVKTIGHQQVRIDWLKKKLGISNIPVADSY